GGGGAGPPTNLAPPLAKKAPTPDWSWRNDSSAGPTRSGCHHPLRRARQEQRQRARDPRRQDRSEGLRLLANPPDPATQLPHPLLPDQRPQPRPPPLDAIRDALTGHP